MNRLFCCLLGISLLASCGSKQPQIDRIREGGVEVVINHVEPYRIKGQPSTFSLEKVFSIDTERTDLAEAGMGSAGEWDADDEGNVYIVGFKNEWNFIYRFDSSGRLLGSFGRRGQGPGELQWPFLSGIVSAGRIALTDNMHKFIVYDLNGKVLQETRLLRQPAQHIDPRGNGK